MRQSLVRVVSRSLGAALMALGLFFLGSCVVNPATGSRQFVLMTEGQEIRLGQESDPGIVASMGLYPDDEVQHYVQRLGSELAARSERPDLPWTFRVLDDPLINAFALPGGYIYVTRGIMAYLESEAELAGILGHEIGHVTARHSVDQISRAQLAQFGIQIGIALKPELQDFEGLASASLQLLFLKFGRDDEHQADELGVRYMGRMGYDPAQLSGVMGMLGRVTAGGGSGVPEWLSTHPNPDNREENILAMSTSAEVAADPPRLGRMEYLPFVDGLTFGENPRHGFFQESKFIHPDMAFQMIFPQGWAAVNMQSAVQASSPEEDALLQLTLAEGEPDAALSAFLSQAGIQAGGSFRGSSSGIQTVGANFRYEGEGEGELLEGRITLLRHLGVVFQLVAVGIPDTWAQRAPRLFGAMESFRPLIDRSLLGVQPARIKVIAVSRAMTLQAFLRQQGVSDRLEDVQLLNRFEGNPNLQVGQRVKVPMGGTPTPGG
jgi:predicted Zn-dependent protease